MTIETLVVSPASCLIETYTLENVNKYIDGELVTSGEGLLQIE